MNMNDRCKTSWIPYLRVFHSTPTVPSVDVYLGTNLIASHLKFSQMSEELPIRADVYTLHVCSAGNPANKIFSRVVTVTPGTSLCAIIDNIGSLETLMIDEPYLVVGEGKSLLRFGNLSSVPVNIITADGNALFSQIAAKTVGDYLELSAGRYNFQVASPDKVASPILIQNIELPPERACTIYVLDNEKEQHSLKVVISQDRNTCVSTN